MKSAYSELTVCPDAAEASEKVIRVAWLFPMMLRTHYWQPVFKEFARLIPNTTFFIGRWGGFAAGYECKFNLRVVNGVRPIILKNNQGGERYDSGFCWAPLSIIKELIRFSPDVIFSTGFSTWTVCALLHKLARRSKVIILWDGCSVHIASETSKARHLQRRLMAPFIDYGVSNMREGVEYLRSSLRIPARKLLAHPYQVADPAILDSSPDKCSFAMRRRPIFLYVAGIDARKGWRYLLEAARLLTKRGIDQFSIVFVGAGREESELRTQIADGLSHVAEHVGHIPYHQMASCHREADVFVFPTMDDVWGLVLVEAMTFGKPVICSRYAGARELVAHDENGFIVDPRNVQTLAAYMAQFIDDPNLITRFGSQSRKLIAQFTPQRAAQMFANVALHTHFGLASELDPESQAAQGSCS